MVALQACCMCVARMRTVWLACPVCMCVVPKQWWKQCKVDKDQSSSHAIPHASASHPVHRWKAIANGLPVNQRPSNVPITEGNVLKYAARAYFKTLVKNYTTQARRRPWAPTSCGPSGTWPLQLAGTGDPCGTTSPPPSARRTPPWPSACKPSRTWGGGLPPCPHGGHRAGALGALGRCRRQRCPVP